MLGVFDYDWRIYFHRVDTKALAWATAIAGRLRRVVIQPASCVFVFRRSMNVGCPTKLKLRCGVWATPSGGEF